MTGLFERAAWSAVIAAEDARWMRFRRPYQVIQLEIAGITAVAERMGDSFAERLLVPLADILRDQTRQSDLYARPGTWRFQGVLPEQEPDSAPRIEARIRECFRSRLGPELPLGLLIGTATPTTTGGIPAALGAAELAMRPGGSAEEGSPAKVTSAGLPPARPADAHDSLAELERLRRDGLVSDKEYNRKRSEILARL